MAKGDEKKLRLMKVGQSLQPFDCNDWLTIDLLDALPSNKPLMVSVTRSRSLPHNRWFFRLLNKVVENHDEFKSLVMLKSALKEATGLMKLVVNPLTGNAMFIEASLSFEEMDEDEFKIWSRQAVDLLNKMLKYDVVTAYAPEQKLRLAA